MDIHWRAPWKLWPAFASAYNVCRRSSHPVFTIFAHSQKLVQPTANLSVVTSPTGALCAPADDTYFPEDDVEDLEQYRIGGYHPTLIDDSFQGGRYTVVHKLGYGGYSTIWLARDHQQHRYVSLKIKVGETSSSSNENKIMRLLGGRDAKEEGRRFVPKLPDEFSVTGPNGNHSCLVGEPAGLNISASKEMSTNWKFPVESARSIAAQLAMGLLYIHNHGICHGGW